MRRINVGDLKLGDNEKKVLLEVIDSGRISEGYKTREFEKEWAEFVGTKYCVATSSGTGALITVLTAIKELYNLGNRKKVITSPITYISDANALCLTGFEPVFVDVDPETFCITPETIGNHLKQVKDVENYSMIMPIDLMGYPVRINEINDIAKKYGLIVIEDAAEAHGTKYNGNKCGASAEAGIFSFYIAHNIQAGELGAITTDNYELYRLAKKIKANGRVCVCEVCKRAEGKCSFISPEGDMDPRFLHDIVGYNFKTMEFPTAIAVSQLQNIQEIIAKRQKNVLLLNQGLQKYEEILQLPIFSKDISYLAYPIVLKLPDKISRRKIRKELENRGVETRPLFGCIPTQQPAYKQLISEYEGRLPVAEYLGENGFYIGCHQYLSRADIEYVVNVFNDVLEKVSI